MPTEPETYGDAPGWKDAMRTEAPVPASPDAPPASDVEAAPSAAPDEQEQGAEPSSAPSQPDPESVPFNKHPRWIERQQELERERQEKAELQRQNQLLLETMQRVAPQPQPAPVQDFWAGKVDHPDAATAQFYQQQKQMFDLAVEQGKQRAIAELQPVLQAGMERLAQVDIREFRKENPEIKPNSEEERAMVAYLNGQVDGVKHTLESAKRNVLFDRMKTENQALKSKQATTPQKRQAASSDASAGIPQTAGLPGKPGDWREQAHAVLDKGGTMKDVLGLVFGGGRRSP